VLWKGSNSTENTMRRTSMSLAPWFANELRFRSTTAIHRHTTAIMLAPPHIAYFWELLNWLTSFCEPAHINLDSVNRTSPIHVCFARSTLLTFSYWPLGGSVEPSWWKTLIRNCYSAFNNAQRTELVGKGERLTPLFRTSWWASK
jgi:hypothetical protein